MRGCSFVGGGVWGVVVGRGVGLLGCFGDEWSECFLGIEKERCKVVCVVNAGHRDEIRTLVRFNTIDGKDQR